MSIVLVALVVVTADPARLTVDTHLHVTMDRASKPFFVGEPGRGSEARSPKTLLKNQIEADQLIKSGGRLAVATLWPPPRLRPGRRALDEALNQLAQLKAFVREQPDFAVVKSVAEAREQIALGRIALIPGIEGGEGIESVHDVDRLYAAGARSVTLVHFLTSQLGGAANGQLAYNLLRVHPHELTPVGLTDLGRDVVTRMFELGMVVDLAHASDALSADVLALAEQHEVPVINSHSAARALFDMERSIPDVLAARIARGGGMVGVTISSHQLGPAAEADRWQGYAPGTCDDVIANWTWLMKVVPPEQLNLGSDFNGWITRPLAGGSCPLGVRNTDDLPELYDALVAHGVPPAAIDGMGRRFLQLWEGLEKRSSPDAIEQARGADPYAHSTFDVAM